MSLSEANLLPRSLLLVTLDTMSAVLLRQQGSMCQLPRLLLILHSHDAGLQANAGSVDQQ